MLSDLYKKQIGELTDSVNVLNYRIQQDPENLFAEDAKALVLSLEEELDDLKYMYELQLKLDGKA